MRPFEPLDAVRCAVVGEKGMYNLAVTLIGLCRPRSFGASLLGLSRRRMWPRARGSAWVWAEGAHVHGIASVRPRSGTKSWELSHLYAASTDGVSVARLLEKATAQSALHGAERIFLRVEADSDIISAARLAGFVPCFQETLYRGPVGGNRVGHGLLHAKNRLRDRRPEDDYELFRLYNASTPLRARQLIGMTFDQWNASRERGPGRLSERVIEVDGALKAWLATARRLGTASIAATLHPDYVGLTDDIVDAGLGDLNRARTVLALAREDTPLLAAALERRRLQPAGDFLMLVKATARTVREKVPARSSLAAAE